MKKKKSLKKLKGWLLDRKIRELETMHVFIPAVPEGHNRYELIERYKVLDLIKDELINKNI